MRDENHDSEAGARRAVVAALIGNTGVAASKLVAFIFTGSAAMLAEFYHSCADTINQVFLCVSVSLCEPVSAASPLPPDPQPEPSR